MTGDERWGSWLLRAPKVSLEASVAASLRDGGRTGGETHFTIWDLNMTSLLTLGTN